MLVNFPGKNGFIQSKKRRASVKNKDTICLPKMLFSMGLDPFAIYVYVFLKNLCHKTGYCILSAKEISGIFKISQTTYRKNRNLLIEKALISTKKRLTTDGGHDTDLIKINEI